MKSYHKNELCLKEFFHDTYFCSDNDELNGHIKSVLAKLDEILISSKANELKYINIKSNFISQLKKMPISVFESSYISILAIMSLTRQEQEFLLRKLDEQLNTNVFADTRKVNKVKNGNKFVDEYSFEPHIYEIGDIVSFFTSFKLKITRHVDDLIVKYLAENKIDKNITMPEQKEKIRKYLAEIEDDSSNIINYIISEYEKWIGKLNPCVMNFCTNVKSDFKSQVKTGLENYIIDLDKKKDRIFETYDSSVADRISTYKLVKRS